ncbi:MAG: hypothetical protein O2923_01420 [Verrucomicrobia bacterium]|nr:hypothetical protein [Verrucomicrobiota bacterium]MDA1085453.1 hypothetical protein [Verrucomicrobiota bacterium]
MTSIAELKKQRATIAREIERKRVRAERLRKKIRQKRLELDALESALAVLEGAGVNAAKRPGTRRRPRKNQRDLVIELLKKSGKPMDLDQIVAGMVKKGYRFASKNPKRALSVTIYPDKATFKKVKPSVFTLR